MLKTCMKAKNNELVWYDKFVVLVKENSFYKSEFSCKLLCIVFEYLLQALDNNFYLLHKNELIKQFFCNSAIEQDNNAGIENKNTTKENKEFDEQKKFITQFVNKLNEYKIEYEELKTKQKRYEICFAANNTIMNCKNIFLDEIKKYEDIELNNKLENLLVRIVKMGCKYKIALQLQIIVDIYFYFDVYFRDNTFGINNDSFVCIIEIYKCLYKMKYNEIIEMSCVFICIKNYMNVNIQKMNIKNKNDLKSFVSDLKLLEEIMCNYEKSPIDNFEEFYGFFDTCIEGKAETSEQKMFCNKFVNEQ